MESIKVSEFYAVARKIQHIPAVLVVQWLGFGLVIERSLVRLPAGALAYQVN